MLTPGTAGGRAANGLSGTTHAVPGQSCDFRLPLGKYGFGLTHPLGLASHDFSFTLCKQTAGDTPVCGVVADPGLHFQILWPEYRLWARFTLPALLASRQVPSVEADHTDEWPFSLAHPNPVVLGRDGTIGIRYPVSLPVVARKACGPQVVDVVGATNCARDVVIDCA